MFNSSAGSIPARFADADEPPRTRDIVAQALLASLVLHAVVMAAAIIWRASIALPPIQQEIPVELLTPGQFEAMTAPVPPPETDVDRAAAPQPSIGPPMIAASRMLSAGALADPLSREAREMLPTFNGTERMVQLCNLEAMEQVQAARPDVRPERIVAYAMADLAIHGSTVVANGAAFRSAGRWYNLRFTCGLSASGTEVRSFAFLVGVPVPEAEWEAHNLLVND